MRSVNLLPARYRPARPSGERPGIGYAAVGVLAALLLMILLYVLTNNGINDAKDKTAKAQAEQQAAQARAGQLGAFANFATLKTSRENAVKRIAEVRFDWERLMRETALLLPKNVYLTTFSAAPPGEAAATTSSTGGATGTGPTISIGGCAPNHPAVATTLVRLRKLHDVVSVDLASSTKAGSAGGGATGGVSTGFACPVAWQGTLAMNAEQPPTRREPVPARLGGGQ